MEGVKAIAPHVGALAWKKLDNAMIKKCQSEKGWFAFGVIPITKYWNQETCPYDVWKELPNHYECDKANKVNVLSFYGGGDPVVSEYGLLVSINGHAYAPHNYWLRFLAEKNGCKFSDEDVVYFKEP